ncbi:MAG: hypothetical protein KDC05_02355 [Bacteroidales bacterium]|nr:hypothetical protein [Bacteroidales bacterium]
MYKIKNRVILLLTVFLTGVLVLNSLAQSKATIENIDFYAEGSKLVITYDIVNAKDGETFETWAKITTESGKEIIPTTTYGDIGKGVTGGPNKRIEWDLQSDNISIDEAFSVEVYARSDLKDKKKEDEPKIKTQAKGISPVGAMALSAILPGLGRTVAKGGGGQWVLGLVGYGFVAGSVIMNNGASNAYEDYLVAETLEDRDDLFEEAENKDLYSKVFIGGAAAIWIFDIIYTGAVADKERRSKNQKGLSLNYQFDPQSGAPLLGLRFTF